MRNKVVLNFAGLTTALLLLLLPASCGKKEEVAAPTFAGSEKIQSIVEFNKAACSQFTLIKPKVDFLFLWDNSTSANFINPESKSALQNTINLVSSRFNYHVVLSPLLSGTTTPPLFLMVADTDGLSDSAKSHIIPSDHTNNLDIFGQIPSVQGSLEKGLQRVTDVLGGNVDNGIFRKDAFTVVVLISNGDDNSYTQINNSPAGAEAVFATKYGEISTIAKTTLHSEQFRFITIVRHSSSYAPSASCPVQGNRPGLYYKRMSEKLYEDLPAGAKTALDDAHKDSYDLCSMSFNGLFDGVNQTIQDVVVSHVYNYWPVATTTDPEFNPKKISVSKNTGVVLAENDPNGFKFVGLKTDWPTRILPSPGEPFTGYLIELMGSGKVTFPECLIIKTEEPADFYGYVVLDKKPNISTIEIEKNGKKLVQSASNGWMYDNYYVSKNIKIKSPIDPSPQEPGEFKSGYFVKLTGSAIISNSDDVKYSFKPGPIE